MRELLHQLLYATDYLIKRVHLDEARAKAMNETYLALLKTQALYSSLQLYTITTLV